MTPEEKHTLQHASSLANKTTAEFLLESGLNAAFNLLADRVGVALDDKPSAKFTALLDAPADNPGLRKLLARKPAWEA